MRRPPFVWIGGQPYLDVAFDLEPLTARPLAHLLEALLDHHHESELVLLRPLSAREREQLGKLAGLGDGVTGRERDLALLGLLFAAGSSLTLVLAQELLGDGARINTPGTVSDVNWTWRLPRSLEELASDADVRSRFGAVRELATRSGRLRV